MKIRRWSKFRFGDYYISWISIVILLLFSITSIMLELSLLLVIFPLAYVIIWIGTILFPYWEKFYIDRDSIYVFWGRKTKKINLPNEVTLIVSYADICPPLTVRTALGNRTHILKDKLAVSILEKMPVEFVLETLHKNRIPKYTTSSIRTVFDEYRYIYSFVCNQSLINELIGDRKCLLIIPESLSKSISFNASNASVYIDLNY